MKKLLCIVLTALLLMGTLALLWPVISDIAFEAKLQAISNAYSEISTISLHWYHTEGFGSYYLGSENGYDIFYANYGHKPGSVYVDVGMDPSVKDSVKEEAIKAAYTTEIAGNVFYPAGEGELMVYCKNDPVVLTYNGNKISYFQPLSSLYEAEKISKTAVDEAAKRFYEYMDIWDTDSEELEYAYFKYGWYTALQENDGYKSESLRIQFVRYRDRLEQEGLRIPDWVDE